MIRYEAYGLALATLGLSGLYASHKADRFPTLLDRLEVLINRLEDAPPTMQQNQSITVPSVKSSDELQDERVRDILAQWEQIDGLPTVARTTSAKDGPVH